MRGERKPVEGSSDQQSPSPSDVPEGQSENSPMLQHWVFDGSNEKLASALFSCDQKFRDMPGPSYSTFQEPVVHAAEAVLKQTGRVGPLELFQPMQLLQPVHFEGCRNGHDDFTV